MEQQQNKMGYAPITPLVIQMALPAICSMLIQALYNVIDSIYVSRISSEALSAISLAYPIQILMIAVLIGTSVGMNSLIARRLGERRQEEANDAATHGLILAIISWAAIALVGFFFSRPFFAFSTDNETIIEMGTSYARIVTVFCIFSSIQICMEKMLQATGNMIFPMCSQLIGCVVNIILDPIFIFGYFGFPEMGIRGAAIATVTGQAIGMIFIVLVLIFGKHKIQISFKNFHFKKKIVADIYKVGFPSIVMQAIGSIMTSILNLIMISFSEAAVNVLGIYNKLQSFIFMPVMGLNQGVMPIMGYNYGAGDKKRLIKTLKTAILFALIIMGIGFACFQIFPNQLLSLFNADEETLAIGVRAMRTISLCFIPAAVGIMFSSLFQATGYAFFSLILSLTRQLVIIVPVAYLLAQISLNAVWYAFPIAETASLILGICFFIWLYNKKIKNLKPYQEHQG